MLSAKVSSPAWAANLTPLLILLGPFQPGVVIVEVGLRPRYDVSKLRKMLRCSCCSYPHTLAARYHCRGGQFGLHLGLRLGVALCTKRTYSSIQRMGPPRRYFRSLRSLMARRAGCGIFLGNGSSRQVPKRTSRQPPLVVSHLGIGKRIAPKASCATCEMRLWSALTCDGKGGVQRHLPSREVAQNPEAGRGGYMMRPSHRWHLASTHTAVVLNMGRLGHEASISCGWIVRRRRQPA